MPHKNFYTKNLGQLYESFSTIQLSYGHLLCSPNTSLFTALINVHLSLALVSVGPTTTIPSLILTHALTNPRRQQNNLRFITTKITDFLRIHYFSCYLLVYCYTTWLDVYCTYIFIKEWKMKNNTQVFPSEDRKRLYVSTYIRWYIVEES